MRGHRQLYREGQCEGKGAVGEDMPVTLSALKLIYDPLLM